MPRPQPHRAATRCAIFCVSQARETRNASPASQMEPFARAARSQERTAAQPRGLDRTPPERKLAAKSPPQPHLHTPLSLPLERERLHARGGARKAKGTCSATAFFLRLVRTGWAVVHGWRATGSAASWAGLRELRGPQRRICHIRSDRVAV